MKKTLYDVFDEATPSELDLLSEQMEAAELQHEMLASVKSKVYAKTQPVHVHNKKGRIIAMKKNSTRIYKCLLASAVCLAMVLGCFAGYYAFLKQPSPAHSDPVPPPTTAPAENQAVVTTVTLDINPSIEITADKEERVLKVSALNKDA
ncbi:MAG: hypothetical protein IJX08_05705 [Clostridia bacterium]|nr:hypothetical protein [Clostridia bacterium]